MDQPTRTEVPQVEPAGVPSPAADADLTGTLVGDYQILRRLGQGGMGQVYLAEQVSLKRKVALKILRAELAANPTYLLRFKAEAEAAARATHANIVQVHAIGEAQGLHYMAMEYVEGRNLRDFIARKGPPELPLALAIMRQVAAALLRAGELGIIHRDIKPENILLTRKGEVKVADFGLSRMLTSDQPLNLTQSGVTMGTPLYMSPEQVQGQTLDPRTDMYSFGVTCYHMLAGHPPFRGESAFQVALQHVQNEAQPLETVRTDLPPELCAVVHKMMAKRPDERYQTPRELLRDLARLREALGSGGTGAQAVEVLPSLTSPVARGAPTPTSLPTLTQRARPEYHRRRFRWLAVGGVLLAFLGGFGATASWYYFFSRAPTGSGAVISTQSTSPNGAEESAVRALLVPGEREEFLKREVERYANPTDDRAAALGLDAYLQLALLYLEQDRIKDAEQLFDHLIAQEKVRRYTFLGHLGRAIVLAAKDDAVESNKLFLRQLGGRPVSPDRRAAALVNPVVAATLPGGPLRQQELAWVFEFLKSNPRFRAAIGKALDRNARNHGPLPAPLETFRKPPGLPT